MAETSKIQTIEELTGRFQDLDKERTRVHTLLEQAQLELEELLAEAERDYGTRDLKELKSKLKELDSENLKMRKQYQKNLSAVERQLAQVEERLEDTELKMD